MIHINFTNGIISDINEIVNWRMLSYVISVFFPGKDIRKFLTQGKNNIVRYVPK